MSVAVPVLELRGVTKSYGPRLVLGGIVVGTRTVVTRARSTMAVVTLEDLQGSVEVVVFPKLYDQTAAIWAEGSILLVAGRVDHRGEDVSLLADLVVPWDEAVPRGPEEFARQVAAGDRGGFRRRQGGLPGQPGERGAIRSRCSDGGSERQRLREAGGSAGAGGCRTGRAFLGAGWRHHLRRSRVADAAGRRAIRLAAPGRGRGRGRPALDRTR